MSNSLVRWVPYQGAGPFAAFRRAEIIEACRSTLPSAAAAELEEPSPSYLYLPDSHIKAIDPDGSLVSGSRGSGKTFWWKVLADDNLRALVAQFVPRYRLNDLQVVQAYGTGESPNWPTLVEMDQLVKSHEPEIIWRAIILTSLSDPRLPTGATWLDRCAWVRQAIERTEDPLRLLDQLHAEGRPALLLFDALDRVASTWTEIYRLLSSLLRLVADIRLFRGLRAKVFLRHDMLVTRAITGFPDASKLIAGTAELTWSARDLYALLFQRLGHAKGAPGEYFRAATTELGAGPWTSFGSFWQQPQRLRRDEDFQREVIHAMAGPWMGREPRRGNTGTWLPKHLADAYGQVSPRSLLCALREAAEVSDPHEETYFPLTWQAVSEGVKKSSDVRVAELRHEYPWVDDACEPLEGQEVPIEASRIIQIWQSADTLARMLGRSEERCQPDRLAEGPQGVIAELVELGVLLRMSDGRLQMPDLYRLAFRLKRRGGVPPSGGFKTRGR